MRTERIYFIEKFILENKTVSLDKLCEKFNVSKNTIRRDIDILVEKGIIKKVYGGVTICEPQKLKYKNILLPFDERNSINQNEKDIICRIASNYINENDTIYIDTGTTCINMIKYISHKNCTIITNSLQICISSIPYKNLNIISLPGKLKRETFSFIGNELENYLKIYNINKAFMTCTGLTIKNGLTNSTTEEYTIKKAIIENSKKIFVMADNSKFGKISLMTYSKLDKIDYIITNKNPSYEYIDFFEKNNIKLITSK